jgi:hypothetical protein
VDSERARWCFELEDDFACFIIRHSCLYSSLYNAPTRWRVLQLLTSYTLFPSYRPSTCSNNNISNPRPSSWFVCYPLFSATFVLHLRYSAIQLYHQLLPSIVKFWPVKQILFTELPPTSTICTFLLSAFPLAPDYDYLCLHISTCVFSFWTIPLKGLCSVKGFITKIQRGELLQ